MSLCNACGNAIVVSHNGPICLVCQETARAVEVHRKGNDMTILEPQRCYPYVTPISFEGDKVLEYQVKLTPDSPLFTISASTPESALTEARKMTE